LAGAQTPYNAPPITVPVVDGFLHLSFAALPGKGNAVLSGVQASCAPPQPATPAALPKFIAETFLMNSGTPVGNAIAFTLSKTPVPDSGMFISFQGDPSWWQSVVQFVKPDTSKTVNLTPPSFSGKLQIAYWSLDQ